MIFLILNLFINNLFAGEIKFSNLSQKKLACMVKNGPFDSNCLEAIEKHQIQAQSLALCTLNEKMDIRINCFQKMRDKVFEPIEFTKCLSLNEYSRNDCLQKLNYISYYDFKKKQINKELDEIYLDHRDEITRSDFNEMLNQYAGLGSLLDCQNKLLICGIKENEVSPLSRDTKKINDYLEKKICKDLHCESNSLEK